MTKRAIEGHDDTAKPVPPPIFEPVEETPERHPLEDAPINSKIVVTQDADGRHVIFVEASANGRPRELPKTDLGYRLPGGSRIDKLADGKFSATVLNIGDEHTPLVTETVAAAVSRFVTHFEL